MSNPRPRNNISRLSALKSNNVIFHLLTVPSRLVRVMAPAPCVARVFWPGPTLPRLGSCDTGVVRDTDKNVERHVLVGWWRDREDCAVDDNQTNTRRPANDVVVAGSVTSSSNCVNDETLRKVFTTYESGGASERFVGKLTMVGEVVRVGGGDGEKFTMDAASSDSQCPIRIYAHHPDDQRDGTHNVPRIDLVYAQSVTKTKKNHVANKPGTPRLILFDVQTPAAFFFQNTRDDYSLSPNARWVTTAVHSAGVLNSLKTRRRSNYFYLQTVSRDSFFRIPGAVRFVAGTLADVLQTKWIPGLRSKHAWYDARKNDPITNSKDQNPTAQRKPGKWRDTTEVFASAKVLRCRLRWLENGGDGDIVSSDVARLCPSLLRALVFGRLVQIVLDILLGVLLKTLLLKNVDTFVAFASGTNYLKSKGLGSAIPTPLFGESIRKNAGWLMRGSPLGVKLHAPLCNVLGTWAMLLVEALGQVVSTQMFRAGIKTCITLIAQIAPFGGASLSLALLADVTTFLTTHVAALHVYSSLLVTAQWVFGQKLLRMVMGSSSGNSLKKSNTMGALSRLESTTFGVLALTPLSLLFPTTFAFYASYLAIHAFTVSARGVLVFFSSVVQHLPLHLTALRVFNPNSFPGVVDIKVRRSIDGKKRESGKERALYVMTRVPVPSYRVSVSQFTTAAFVWVSTVVVAVASACVSLGRLPVALIPFEPDTERWAFA